MADQPYPDRVRLADGRNVHAAKAIDIGHMTACAIYVGSRTEAEWLPSETALACRRCARDLQRKTTA